MKITEVRSSDIGYYATVDGIEANFDGESDYPNYTCDRCGRPEQYDPETEEYNPKLYLSMDPEVVLCRNCLESACTS